MRCLGSLRRRLRLNAAGLAAYGVPRSTAPQFLPYFIFSRTLLRRLVLGLFADPILGPDHLIKLRFVLNDMIFFRSHAFVAGRH